MKADYGKRTLSRIHGMKKRRLGDCPISAFFINLKPFDKLRATPET